MREELINYGLSQKETDTYLALLRTGTTTAHQLSTITNIRRSTIYEVLETLKRKGLTTTHKEHKKTYYTPAHPQALIERLQEQQEKIHPVLQQLEELYIHPPEQPTVTHYTGKTGVREAANDMLTAQEILVYGASTKADEQLQPYTANFAKKRVEKNIHMKSIIGEIPQHMIEPDVQTVTQIRKLNWLKQHTTAYFIYNDKTLIINIEPELTATRIQSTSIANSQRTLFEALWKQAEQPSIKTKQ